MGRVGWIYNFSLGVISTMEILDYPIALENVFSREFPREWHMFCPEVRCRDIAVYLRRHDSVLACLHDAYGMLHGGVWPYDIQISPSGVETFLGIEFEDLCL